MDLRNIDIDKINELEKGSLVLVRWLDASDHRCRIAEHENNPEVHCKDWGVYLGCSGRKKKILIIGKDVVEIHNDWGATRIPVELVEEIIEISPRSKVIQYIKEVSVLKGRVSIRKYYKGS